MLSRYVEPTEQLVTEILVRDVRRSVAFYRRLGFELLRDAGDFVELTWEDHRLFLAEATAFRDVHVEDVAPAPFPTANVRVMVPDVDRWWKLANDSGARPGFGVQLSAHDEAFRDFYEEILTR